MDQFVFDSGNEGYKRHAVSLECFDQDHVIKLVEDRFIGRFSKNKPGLTEDYHEGNFPIIFNFAGPGGLELHKRKGRSKRLV